jgi:hypothetical protein
MNKRIVDMKKRKVQQRRPFGRQCSRRAWWSCRGRPARLSQASPSAHTPRRAAWAPCLSPGGGSVAPRLLNYMIQPLVELYGGCMVVLTVSWCARSPGGSGAPRPDGCAGPARWRPTRGAPPQRRAEPHCAASVAPQHRKLQPAAVDRHWETVCVAAERATPARPPSTTGGAADAAALSSSSYLRLSYSSGGLYGELYERAYIIRYFPRGGGVRAPGGRSSAAARCPRARRRRRSPVIIPHHETFSTTIQPRYSST